MPREQRSQQGWQSHVRGRPPARPPSRQLRVSRGYSKGRPFRGIGFIVTRVLPAAWGSPGAFVAKLLNPWLLCLCGCFADVEFSRWSNSTLPPMVRRSTPRFHTAITARGAPPSDPCQRSYRRFQGPHPTRRLTDRCHSGDARTGCPPKDWMLHGFATPPPDARAGRSGPSDAHVMVWIFIFHYPHYPCLRSLLPNRLRRSAIAESLLPSSKTRRTRTSRSSRLPSCEPTRTATSSSRRPRTVTATCRCSSTWLTKRSTTCSARNAISVLSSRTTIETLTRQTSLKVCRRSSGPRRRSIYWNRSVMPSTDDFRFRSAI
jgi:hypothetical protein